MILLMPVPPKVGKGLAFCGIVLLSGLLYYLANGAQPSVKLIP